jgi:hypothetical protein
VQLSFHCRCQRVLALVMAVLRPPRPPSVAPPTLSSPPDLPRPSWTWAKQQTRSCCTACCVAVTRRATTARSTLHTWPYDVLYSFPLLSSAHRCWLLTRAAALPLALSSAAPTDRTQLQHLVHGCTVPRLRPDGLHHQPQQRSPCLTASAITDLSAVAVGAAAAGLQCTGIPSLCLQRALSQDHYPVSVHATADALAPADC